MSSKFAPTAMDIIFLIHNATLELYGIEKDGNKSVKLARLLHAVADGERTFRDSDSEKFFVALREEAKAEGIDMDQIQREGRIRERNAARWLEGLPPLES